MTVIRPTEQLAFAHLRHFKRLERCQPKLAWYIVRFNFTQITVEVLDQAVSRERADRRIDEIPHRHGDLFCAVPGLSKEHIQIAMQAWLSAYNNQ